MQTENLTRTEKIISWAVLAVVISLLNGCAWLLAEKDNIVVVEQKEGTLEITAEYYMAGDDYLLGIPAMMMRVTGLEPPATIQGAAKAIDPRSVGKRAGPHEAILVNATDQELWYTPFIFGDEGSLPRNAPTETAKLPPDSAMRILAKTHGDYRRGCNQKPGERETFSYGNGEGPSMAILGWITPTTPDACNAARQATKTTGDNPKLSQKSNATIIFRTWAPQPTDEPMATCYRLWEEQVASRAKDSWLGSLYLARELSEKYPSCFQGKHLETFPRFGVGTNGSEVQHRLCIEWGASEYEKAWQANWQTAAQTYLEALARRTGDYCVKDGRPKFTTDKGRRPLYPSRDECNADALKLAKDFRHHSNMRALCFDENGAPRFSLAPFADIERAKDEGMKACSKGFESAAAIYLRELDQEEPEDSFYNPYLGLGGAVKKFMSDNSQCFEEGTPRFPLSGTYSNDASVKQVLENEQRSYRRLKKLTAP